MYSLKFLVERGDSMKKGLDAKAFALAAGIFWSVCIFVMTFVVMFTDYGFGLMTAISKIYIGYNISVLGAFIGAAYGFADAFIACYIFAWLYNKLSS